jgi:hypothetical protein
VLHGVSKYKHVLIHTYAYYEMYLNGNCKFPHVCVKQQRAKLFDNFPFKIFGMLKLVLSCRLVTFCPIIAMYMSRNT